MTPRPADTRSDEELIDAVNDGDVAAFEALYHRHRDWVYRLACRFCADTDEALDVLQETFAYFLGKFPGFVLTARLTTFFYPVVKNISLRLKHKRGRYQGDDEILESMPGPAAEADSDLDDLKTVLAALPPAQRDVLILRFVDDLSLAEIAEVLSIPLGTVKSRLHLGLARLREDPVTRGYFEQ